jgi:glyoxylase-like metal-dependent hydrolase (beta-lactamase superfamily II)
MHSIDILLAGVPGRTDQGYLGQSTVALVDGTALVDTGGPSRQPLLEDTLAAVGVDPNDVEDVLLTHCHFDHCDNVDVFPGATVHAYGPELDRVFEGDPGWATSTALPGLLADRDVSRFSAGDTVAGLEVAHTPGHAAHHVAFLGEATAYGEALTVGLVGDAIKNVREFETRDPTAIHDESVAAATIDALADRLDFVVPGHDVPFYVTDGGAEPCGEVALELAVQTGAGAGTRVRVASDRGRTRALPDFVADRTRGMLD